MTKAAKSLASMTRPCQGSMIVGKQLGSINVGQYKMPTFSEFKFRHDKESMKGFWQQVWNETATSWKVEANMYQGAGLTENNSHAW